MTEQKPEFDASSVGDHPFLNFIGAILLILVAVGVGRCTGWWN